MGKWCQNSGAARSGAAEPPVLPIRPGAPALLPQYPKSRGWGWEGAGQALHFPTLLIYSCKIELPFAGMIFHHPCPRAGAVKQHLHHPSLPGLSLLLPCLIFQQTLDVTRLWELFPGSLCPRSFSCSLCADKNPSPCLSNALVIYCSVLKNVLGSGCPSSLTLSTWDGTFCLLSPRTDPRAVK